MAKNPPEKLYKYQNFSTQSLTNLKSQVLYLNSPRNFNDPYDSSVNVKIEALSSQHIEIAKKVMGSYEIIKMLKNEELIKRLQPEAVEKCYFMPI